ncbi:hypothetical protein [Acanthopleuribacter pedis]|uniref:Uncharacterized protein n=1 Tax=Acanthopleuribacter pedis TaxID=442870 RepID=A0A8J7Q8G6_9BACT|nr:hypothetical protein [Acanthopleuribacter pedis]MBO1318814.1 hypothetical protein [Acanthopleuribacter pedis]
MFVALTSLLTALVTAPPTALPAAVSAESAPVSQTQAAVPNAVVSDPLGVPTTGIYYIMPEYWNPMGDQFFRYPFPRGKG